MTWTQNTHAWQSKYAHMHCKWLIINIYVQKTLDHSINRVSLSCIQHFSSIFQNTKFRSALILQSITYYKPNDSKYIWQSYVGQVRQTNRDNKEWKENIHLCFYLGQNQCHSTRIKKSYFPMPFIWDQSWA